jgi:Ca2+-binding EF-hand superfamily protein
MFNRRMLISALIAGSLMMPWVALAQDPPPRPDRPGAGRGGEPRGMAGQRPGFGILGMLMPTDPAEILRQHPQADTDGDGRLSPTEYRAFVTSQRAVLEKELLAAHPQLDTDGDGALSPEEMRAGSSVVEEFAMAKVLASNPQADTDGDGKLSREEFRAFQSRRMGGPPQSPAASLDWILENFERIDADGNGQLTVAELQQFRRQFDRDQRGRRVGAGVREGGEARPDDQPRGSRDGRGPRDGGQRAGGQRGPRDGGGRQR